MKNLSSIIILLSSVAIILNINWFGSTVLGLVSLFLFLASTGYLFGSLFWNEKDKTILLINGALITISLAMILGSAFYYLSNLSNKSATIIILAITVFAIFSGWIKNFIELKNDEKEKDPDELKSESSIFPPILISISFIIFIGLAFKILVGSATYESIRSPWEVLPKQFFIFVFLATCSLILIAIKKIKFTIPASALLLFLFFSITNFVYPLGYGFDPFVHQATESYIAEHGTITPKPFFYVGQYALVDTLQNITALPIVSIDRFILPILLSIFLVAAGWFAFKNYLTIALLPVLPITTFASTTPQGIANAFVLLIVLIAFGLRNQTLFSMVPLYILGLATLVTHPISGIPIILFLIIWSILPNLKNIKNINAYKIIRSPNFKKTEKPDRLKYILVATVTTLGAFLLPSLFFAYGLINNSKNVLKTNFISQLGEIFLQLINSLGGFTSRFNFILDFVYLYGMNLTLIIIVSAIGATLFFFVKKERRVLAYLLTSVSLLTSALIMLALIDFSFLPLYEQSGYAERLLDLAKIFILPLSLFAIVWSIKKALDKNSNLIRVAIIMVIAGTITSSLYLTYPHNDAYNTERGWSVGRADTEAVNFINNDAGDNNFIVLANQSVSAAALGKYGFKKYFSFTTTNGEKNTVFYYPIPTGGPLYQYFLTMSYEEPRRATIGDAAKRADVNLGYFVVNKYWWKSEELIERAKREADSWREFSDGNVYIFKFENL